MLTELAIRNFAIIDRLQLAFGEGLTIVSGETGAGKSILIGALSLLLGDRAATDMIRASAEAAVVEAAFDLRARPAVQETLRSQGFEGEGDLVIRRIISRSGRSRAYVNGQLASLGALAEIGGTLVDICGQHAHQALLNPDNHVDLLDAFGGLLPRREAYAEAFREHQALGAALREWEEKRRHRGEREDLLRFQSRELADAALRPGEDAALQEERRVLLHIQKLLELASRAQGALYAEKGCILEELQQVVNAVGEIRKIDGTLPLAPADLEGPYYQLEEAARVLRDYQGRLAPDPERLEEVESRLERIGRLKRKYGATIEEMLRRQAEMEAELAQAASLAEDVAAAEQALAAAEQRLAAEAAALSRLRREAAGRLEQAVVSEIQSLRMPHAVFTISFQQGAAGEAAPEPEAGAASPAFGPKGCDEVLFYLSTNPGEPPKPLHRIASGGELSRILLAMKKVLAETDPRGTIVFDEVDSGIGGATAEVVGRVLREVARRHQVLCITHLPQIACCGERHYRVVKEVGGKRTTTRVEPLSREERVEEISRMLGGIAVTEKTRAHAREMLGAAQVRATPAGG